MKKIEEYKADLDIVLNDMAKIEGYLDAAAKHNNDKLFEEIFGGMIRNDMPEFMKDIDKLVDAMKRSFTIDYLMKPIESEMSGVIDILASIEFIEKQMKTIRTKHAIYYFNLNK